MSASVTMPNGITATPKVSLDAFYMTCFVWPREGDHRSLQNPMLAAERLLQKLGATQSARRDWQ